MKITVFTSSYNYKRTHDNSMVNKNYKEVISNMQKIWDELKPLKDAKDIS